MSQEAPYADWSRTEAINWYVRELHNEAIACYMPERSADRFKSILDILKEALEKLEGVVRSGEPEEEGWGCPPGWCPDRRDRCVPCDDEFVNPGV